MSSFVGTPPRGDAAVFYSKPNELVGSWQVSARSEAASPQPATPQKAGRGTEESDSNNYLSGLVEAALEQARTGGFPYRGI